MAIDFPNSPAVGQMFQVGEKTWIWDGTSWGAKTVSGTSFHAVTHGAGQSDAITIAQSQVTNLTTDIAAKAPLISPTFTGTPAAPTATAGTNTTQLATTAFVSTALSAVDSTFTRTNLVTNPSFEVNTAGWTVIGGLATLSRITSDNMFGVACAQIVRAVNSGGAVNHGLDTNSASYFPISAGLSYMASAYVKAVSGSPDLFITIAWHTAAGAYISENGISVVSVGTTWQRISASGAAPATAAFARILVRENISALEAAATWLVDSVLLEQSSTLKTYFDGSYSDSGINFTSRLWNGTANASTSTITNSVPVQSGNTGKYLTTDGTSTYWAAPTGGASKSTIFFLGGM